MQRYPSEGSLDCMYNILNTLSRSDSGHEDRAVGPPDQDLLLEIDTLLPVDGAEIWGRMQHACMHISSAHHLGKLIIGDGRWLVRTEYEETTSAMPCEFMCIPAAAHAYSRSESLTFRSIKSSHGELHCLAYERLRKYARP